MEELRGRDREVRKLRKMRKNRAKAEEILEKGLNGKEYELRKDCFSSTVRN